MPTDKDYKCYWERSGAHAFPKAEDETSVSNDGMTLRDWFAGMAMISLVHRREMTATETYARSELALEAYHYAHAMLEARKIPQ